MSVQFQVTERHLKPGIAKSWRSKRVHTDHGEAPGLEIECSNDGHRSAQRVTGETNSMGRSHRLPDSFPETKVHRLKTNMKRAATSSFRSKTTRTSRHVRIDHGILVRVENGATKSHNVMTLLVPVDGERHLRRRVHVAVHVRVLIAQGNMGTCHIRYGFSSHFRAMVSIIIRFL